MSKELFTEQRERMLIDSIRLQETDFYNRQIELKHGNTASRMELAARLQRERTLPRHATKE